MPVILHYRNTAAVKIPCKTSAVKITCKISAVKIPCKISAVKIPCKTSTNNREIAQVVYPIENSIHTN